MGKVGVELIQERKRILTQEEATGTKDAVGGDLLTLLIQANVHDKDGMSGGTILARQSHSFARCARH